MLKFTCHHCGQQIQADDASAGQSANCPTCQAEVVVPVTAVKHLSIQLTDIPSPPVKKTTLNLEPPSVAAPTPKASAPTLPPAPSQPQGKPPLELSGPDTKAAPIKNTLSPPTSAPMDRGFKPATIYSEPRYKTRKWPLLFNELKPSLLFLFLATIISFVVGVYISLSASNLGELGELLQKESTVKQMSMAGLWQLQGIATLAIPVAACLALIRRLFGKPFFHRLLKYSTAMMLIVSGIALFGHFRHGANVNHANGQVRIVNWTTTKESLRSFWNDFTEHLANTNKRVEEKVVPVAPPVKTTERDTVRFMPSSTAVPNIDQGSELENNVLASLTKDARRRLEQIQLNRATAAGEQGADVMMSPAAIAADPDFKNSSAAARKLVETAPAYEQRVEAITQEVILHLNTAVLTSSARSNVLRNYHQQITPIMNLVKEDIKLDSAAGGVVLKMINWLNTTAGTWRIKNGRMEVDAGKDFKFYYLLAAELERCRVRQHEIRQQLQTQLAAN